MKTRKRLIKNCNYGWEVMQILERTLRKDNRYSDCQIDVYGPFGLCCESSIYVKRNDKIIGDLTIIDGNGRGNFLRRSYEDNGLYEPMSIGWLNGMNHKTYPLPTDNEECMRLVFAKTER